MWKTVPIDDACLLESSTTKSEENPTSAAQDSQKPPTGEDIV